jgi:hypothetical protein
VEARPRDPHARGHRDPGDEAVELRVPESRRRKSLMKKNGFRCRSTGEMHFPLLAFRGKLRDSRKSALAALTALGARYGPLSPALSTAFAQVKDLTRALASTPRGAPKGIKSFRAAKRRLQGCFVFDRFLCFEHKKNLKWSVAFWWTTFGPPGLVAKNHDFSRFISDFSIFGACREKSTRPWAHRH